MPNRRKGSINVMDNFQVLKKLRRKLTVIKSESTYTFEITELTPKKPTNVYSVNNMYHEREKNLFVLRFISRSFGNPLALMHFSCIS